MTEHPFAYLFPFLAAMALIQEIFKLIMKRSAGHPKQPEHPKHPEKLGFTSLAVIGSAMLAAFTAALLIRLPVNGIPLAGWLLGLSTNFSIPLTMLLFSRVWRSTTGAPLLDRRALRATWIFGLITGLVLYPQALGLTFGNTGGLDPYAQGYGSAWLSLLLLALTISLLCIKNHFGAVLVVTMLAYDLRLLESPNLWDYLVDPILTLISMVALVTEAISSLRRRYTPRPTPASPTS